MRRCPNGLEARSLAGRRLLITVTLVAASAAAAGCKDAPPPVTPPVSQVAVALADAPDKSFTHGDITINYRDIGTGDAVVLIHGYGDDLRMWAGVADSLARDHRVLALDTRAFGKSSKPAGVENYGKAMAADVIALLDHAEVTQAHVVGFSMGAVIAADVALSYPARVRTVTLVAGVYPADSMAMAALVAPWVTDLQHGRRLVGLLKDIIPVLPDSQVIAFSDMTFAASDSSALTAALQGFPAMSVDWTRVDSSSVPAVVLVGVDDPLHRYAAPLAARWRGARLVELPATDHMTIMASPRVLEEVTSMVNSRPAPPK